MHILIHIYLQKIIINSKIIIHSLPREGMHIKRILNLYITKEEKSGFFGNDIELDDSTFDQWKEELEKELPTFWDSMKK